MQTVRRNLLVFNGTLWFLLLGIAAKRGVASVDAGLPVGYEQGFYATVSIKDTSSALPRHSAQPASSLVRCH